MAEKSNRALKQRPQQVEIAKAELNGIAVREIVQFWYIIHLSCPDSVRFHLEDFKFETALYWNFCCVPFLCSWH